MAGAALSTFLGPQINFPSDIKTNIEMLLRWIHFLAGITWIGLLYFFNFVNVPLMKELDATTKGKVMPALMTRALLWFRMSAALTVLAGISYWEIIVTSDVHNGQILGLNPSHGAVMGSFFLIWTIVWGVLYACLIPGQRNLRQWRVHWRGICRDRCCCSLAVLEFEQSRMGEQSTAFHWDRRRHWLGDAAERLGSDLAHPETADSMDARQRDERHSDAGESQSDGPSSLPMLASECFLVGGDAVLHGRGQPLPDVRKMICA